MGQLAIPRKHPDYLAWDLAVKILGGEGANRLHRVCDRSAGLTYGASADTEAMKQAGDFVAETDTRTDTTGEALQIVIAEMQKIQQVRVSERELGDAQAYLAGSFPLTIETPNDIAVQVLNAMFYELPMKEISTFRERVQSITPDDIQRVAQRTFGPIACRSSWSATRRRSSPSSAPRVHRLRGHSHAGARPDGGDIQTRARISPGSAASCCG